MKGAFIVIEGIDGSGKSTLVDGLVRKFSDREVVLTREPTDDVIGSVIRSGAVKGISQQAEALLFVADRAVHTEAIRKWVSEGKMVICDRYFASTVAYQSSSLNGDSLDREWLLQLNLPVIMVPDVTILLDIDPEDSMGRVHTRGEDESKFEKAPFLREVRDEYLRLANDFGFTVIDASMDRETVLEKAYNAIKEVV